MVFFSDEAHILFDQAPKVLIDKIEHMGRLGLKIQHALRAFTPNDRKVIKGVAQSFRENKTLSRHEEAGYWCYLCKKCRTTHIGSYVGRQIIRGVLGLIFRGKR